jgi:S-DNA-T family DNA segregation ATPase FtsK/SpoIIIE
MITDEEIEKIISYWQKEIPDIQERAPWEQMLNESDMDEDETLLEQAIDVIQNSQRASASLLQRRLRIGYPRAARLLDALEEMGVVGPALGGGRERDVLISPDEEGEI